MHVFAVESPRQPAHVDAPPLPTRTDEQRLPGADRTRFEAVFGQSFADVAIHADHRAASAMNAAAFTFGSDIVFAPGRYAPGTAAGRQLLAHELAHVVQQRQSPTPHVQRESAEKPGTEAEFQAIAAQLREAMAGWGTDEEGIYRALQRLDRDPAAIGAMLKAYRRYGSLVDDLHDELSGGELEYALQLLNLGRAGATQEIETRPRTADEIDHAARRLREAMAGPGTDEEAVFAVLLPFKRQIRQLENAYIRLYQRDLRWDVEDELSGSELTYARELMQTPYETFLREANEKLRSLDFGTTLGEFCEVPDKSSYYDTKRWEESNVGGRHACRLRLRSGVRPSEAVLSLLDSPGEWRVDCHEFVHLAHWYALIKSRGAKEFDDKAPSPFELHPKGTGQSTLKTRRVFQRDSNDSPYLTVFVPGAAAEERRETKQTKHVESALDEAPVGSRVMWVNEHASRSPDPDVQAYARENSLKLSQGTFGAFPLSVGPLWDKRYAMTREEIESKLAEIAGRDLAMPKAEIRRGIYIAEIEEYETPAG